jgi:WhiB family transcriptional regulator, redox-sensing transcriptional regulator
VSIPLSILDDLCGLPSWFARAACHGMTDPDLVFDGPDADALGVCAGCEVRPSCADYALAENIAEGVWGGLTEKDRKVARRDDWAA